MKIAPETLNKASAYKLLTGVVVPRPIAWVSTISPNGVANLAPFSCLTFVSADPPMVGFNSGLRNQQRQDTARNLRATRQFVVLRLASPTARSVSNACSIVTCLSAGRGRNSSWARSSSSMSTTG